MEDLKIDIFLLCLIANKQGPDVYTHSYGEKDLTVFRHKVNKNLAICTALNIEEALRLKNYLEAVTNDSEGDESIWE